MGADMFFRATQFNGAISSWNTESAQLMTYMFQDAFSFNQDISNWNTGEVRDMGYVFSNAKDFDYDVSTWDIGSVEDMEYMFDGAESFSQNLCVWRLQLVHDDIDINNMFRGSKCMHQYDPDLSNSMGPFCHPCQLMSDPIRTYVAHDKKTIPDNFALRDIPSRDAPGGQSQFWIRELPPTSQPQVMPPTGQPQAS